MGGGKEGGTGPELAARLGAPLTLRKRARPAKEPRRGAPIGSLPTARRAAHRPTATSTSTCPPSPPLVSPHPGSSIRLQPLSVGRQQPRRPYLPSPTRMPSPLSQGALRLVAALLLLVLASATVCAAAAGSPVQAGAAHAMAAVARRAAPPQPSRRMGKTKRSAAKAHSQQRRKDYSLFLCPNRVAACPAPAPGKPTAQVKRQELKLLADWFKVGFECVDTRTEMGSCGGCVSLGEGCVVSVFAELARASVAPADPQPSSSPPSQARLHGHPARKRDRVREGRLRRVRVRQGLPPEQGRPALRQEGRGQEEVARRPPCARCTPARPRLPSRPLDLARCVARRLCLPVVCLALTLPPPSS